jgi:hypothetical protein
MEWILVVIVFDLVGSSPRPIEVMHKAYSNIEACDAAGRSFRGIFPIPEDKKSTSICVSREWFGQSGWQRRALG